MYVPEYLRLLSFRRGGLSYPSSSSPRRVRARMLERMREQAAATAARDADREMPRRSEAEELAWRVARASGFVDTEGVHRTFRQAAAAISIQRYLSSESLRSRRASDAS